MNKKTIAAIVIFLPILFFLTSIFFPELKIVKEEENIQTKFLYKTKIISYKVKVFQKNSKQGSVTKTSFEVHLDADESQEILSSPVSIIGFDDNGDLLFEKVLIKKVKGPRDYFEIFFSENRMPRTVVGTWLGKGDPEKQTHLIFQI